MIYDKLYDWQKEIVDRLALRQAFGLWLDCGLGKTVQALALAEKTNSTKVLVVAPNAKACESVLTPGSWQQWATQLGSDWVVRSKGDKHAVYANDIAGCTSKHEAIIKSKKQIATDTAESNKKHIGKAQVAISSTELPPTVASVPFSKAFEGITPNEKTVLIINYEGLFVHGKGKSRPVLKDEILSFIKSCYDQNVILLIDESHYIKDPQSQQTFVLQSIKRELMIVSKYLHVYLLTGTPFTRGFIDVWNQLKFMGCQMTKTEFRERFCVLGNVRGLLGWQQPIIGYKNVDELYQIIHRYAITLKSADVLKLPEQVFVDHFVDASAWFTILTKERLPFRRVVELNELRKTLGMPYMKSDQSEHMESDNLGRLIAVWCSDHEQEELMSYEEALQKNISVQNPWFRNIDYPETNYLCDTPGSLWMRARQLSIGFQGNADEALWCNETRLEAIKQLLEEKPDNYVLFYNYVPEFTELFEICYKLGYNIDVYNGDIKSLSNYERYSKESDDQKVVDTKNIIISNFASGSTGMNWQAYSQCIIASLPTYKHWAQGLKRVHRNGSKSTVFYHVFRSHNWLDEGMWKALMSNEEYSEDMFNRALNEVQM